MMVAVVAFIVLVERGERRIPVQYAKRVVGRRVMGGQSTHMPLKVNAGGVIPVIFASSILAFPADAAAVAVREEHPPGCSQYAGDRSGTASRCITCCSCAASFSSVSSTFRSFSIPTKRPTTCASTAASFRASGRAATRRLHEHDPDQDHVVGAMYLSILCLIPDIMIPASSCSTCR
jgi:preprotein translocase subunit SecY